MTETNQRDYGRSSAAILSGASGSEANWRENGELIYFRQTRLAGHYREVHLPQ
jgi:hypothetical protein